MKKLIFAIFLFVGMIFISCEKDFNHEQGNLHENIDDKSIQKRQTFWGDGETPWTSCEVADFKVYIEDCLSAEEEPEWNNAAVEAFAMYNSIPNMGINISITTNKSEADATITCENDSSKPCTGGSVGDVLPKQGFATKVYINLAFNPDDPKCGDCPDGFSDVDIANIYRWYMLHEFGHVFGFAHTNIIKPDTPLIPGTQKIDLSSVFNSQTGGCYPDGVFSDGDINALQIMYPCECPPEYDAVSKTCIGNQETICFDPGDRKIALDWDVSIPYQKDGEYCIKVKPLSTGNIKINAKAYDNNCIYDFEETLEVYDHRPCELIEVPPMEFENICFGKKACFDFKTYGCLETLEIKTSSSQVVAEVDGTKVCISSLQPRKEEVKLFITPIGVCSDGAEVVWTIRVNNKDCGDDDIFDPFI